MSNPQTGIGVIIGKNVQFGEGVVIWNYVVIGDNTKIGDGTRIGSFCDIGRDVVIGKNCIVQAHVTISNECQLGDNVFIGPNSSLLNDKFPHSRCLTPSIIKSNVVIGGCVTILPNVTVYENSIIAAGSVVTKDVPPMTLVKGVPAKPMMTRQEYENKRKAFIEARKKP
ncbi:MAG: DapH/DapD/GlmU-related protein [Candidatus Bathyarchaeia archaeon]|nr:DapH/DapD/GlmU-related protein [Candidatus Bathyarchaeia archaeon]